MIAGLIFVFSGCGGGKGRSRETARYNELANAAANECMGLLNWRAPDSEGKLDQLCHFQGQSSPTAGSSGLQSSAEFRS